MIFGDFWLNLLADLLRVQEFWGGFKLLDEGVCRPSLEVWFDFSFFGLFAPGGSYMIERCLGARHFPIIGPVPGLNVSWIEKFWPYQFENLQRIKLIDLTKFFRLMQLKYYFRTFIITDGRCGYSVIWETEEWKTAKISIDVTFFCGMASFVEATMSRI